MIKTSLAALAAMSNQYGSNPDYVLAGGGNTSFKTEDRLWIKGSGTALATIRPEDFVVLDRQALGQMWTTEYPAEETAREAAVLADMMAARIPGEIRRPSVETLLHDLFPQQFVLHLHPALINALTCAKKGKEMMEQLLPEGVWVDVCKPGYILALNCREQMQEYYEETGKSCQILLLQNHGIFLAADSTEEIDGLLLQVMGKLSFAAAGKKNSFCAERACKVFTELKASFPAVRFLINPQIVAYDPETKSLSPDHIVYCKARQLMLPADADVKTAVDAFTAENGYGPRIVFAENAGMYACGGSEQEAATAETVMLDAIKITSLTGAFGGVQSMPDPLINFILNWEVERYRSQVSLNK